MQPSQDDSRCSSDVILGNIFIECKICINYQTTGNFGVETWKGSGTDFFSALLNSHMKESREGIIRLADINESVMIVVWNSCALLAN